MAFEVENVDKYFYGVTKKTAYLEPGTKFSTLFGKKAISKLLVGNRFFSRSEPNEKFLKYAIEKAKVLDPKVPFSCAPFASARIIFTDSSTMDFALLNGGGEIAFGGQIFALQTSDLFDLFTLMKQPKQDGAGQPATARELKPEGASKPQPESEARPQ